MLHFALKEHGQITRGNAARPSMGIPTEVARGLGLRGQAMAGIMMDSIGTGRIYETSTNVRKQYTAQQHVRCQACDSDSTAVPSKTTFNTEAVNHDCKQGKMPSYH